MRFSSSRSSSNSRRRGLPALLPRCKQMFEEEFNRNIRAEESQKVCVKARQSFWAARAATEFPISHLSEAAYPHHREKLRRLVIIIFNSNWLFHWGKSHWVSPICLRETRREWQQETRLDSYFVDFWYAGRALTHNVQDDPQLFKNPFKWGMSQCSSSASLALVRRKMS